MTETKTFPTPTVISIVTGRLLCALSELHEALGWMAGRPVYTHEIGEMLDGAALAITGINDGLAEMCAGAGEVPKDELAAWISDRLAGVGSTLPVPRLALRPPSTGKVDGALDWLRARLRADGAPWSTELAEHILTVVLEVEHQRARDRIQQQAAQRGRDKWRAAGGDPMTWPDRADLLVWLVERATTAEQLAEARLQSLKAIDDRIWSAMQYQIEDVRVNAGDHPGLLEPMRDILVELHEQSRAALRDPTAQSAPT